MRHLRSELIPRELCVMCDSPNIKEAFRLNSFPVYMGMGASSTSSESDSFADQVWGVCSDCGCLQLMQLLPLEILYAENHSDPTGSTWECHHRELADFSKTSCYEKDVLEIGAGSGTLANYLILEGGVSSYTAIEPDYTGAPIPDLRVIQGMIEDHLHEVSKHDVIIHSHLLEHLYEPRKTMAQIVHEMRPEAKMILSFPNLQRILMDGGANALNFEHTYYLSPADLEIFLRSLGLEVIEVAEFRSHSVFFICQKKNKLMHAPILKRDNSALEMLKALWAKNARVAADFNAAVKSTPKAIGYVFGAHVFTQGLLASGLEEGHVAAVLDNAISKQGRRLYGSNLYCENPETISADEEPIVALIASHYQSEIREQLLKINKGVRVIE